MSDKPQTFKNHAKFVPLFHFFVLPSLLVNIVWSAYRLYRAPGVDSGVRVLVAVALIVLAVLARVFALTVQDRVIRLEMRLRLKQLLPADLQGRISDFTAGQLVGLRFASDAELPELAARVLRDGMQDRNAIKRMVKNWQPDHLRA